MFNLDQAILEWRRRLAAGGVKTPDVLDELESHLRDDVDQRVREGLSQQQAFEDAVQRLGQANVLKAEFKKGDRTAALRFESIVLDGSGLMYLTTASYTLVTHEMAGQERLLGLAALGLTILSGLGLRYGARWVRAEGRTRMALGIGSTILGIGWFTCFMLLILPHFEFTMSQLVVALLWAFAPMAAAGAFAVGLKESTVRVPGRRVT
ncbi:MAG: permease prefix domain 1-containing protein [Limisphaerales bacterium]